MKFAVAALIGLAAAMVAPILLGAIISFAATMLTLGFMLMVGVIVMCIVYAIIK